MGENGHLAGGAVTEGDAGGAKNGYKGTTEGASQFHEGAGDFSVLAAWQ